MKGLLLALSLFCALLPLRVRAHPLFSEWIPVEKMEWGPLGSGTGTEVEGMMDYQSPPNRRYIILGYIKTRAWLFGSARSRAVALAKEHGADAILQLRKSTRATGHFLLGGQYVESSPWVGAYAAIRFLERKKEKHAWGIASAVFPLDKAGVHFKGEGGEPRAQKDRASRALCRLALEADRFSVRQVALVEKGIPLAAEDGIDLSFGADQDPVFPDPVFRLPRIGFRPAIGPADGPLHHGLSVYREGQGHEDGRLVGLPPASGVLPCWG